MTDRLTDRRALRTTPRRPPWPLLLLAALGLSIFVLPLIGLLVRTPWTALPDLLTSEVAVDALRLSLITSLAATFISALVGVPLAWILARVEFRGRAIVRSLVLLPLVLPPVVGGAALLFALGRRGVVGEPLNDLTGLVLPFSTWGVILATTFVAMPFLVITVEGALRNLDPRYEGAAAGLGASRWTVLRRVTLPMIGPSLAAGLVLTWARAFGEFGATITFAGNLQGRTQTLPLAVFVALEGDRDTAVALSMMMVVIAFGVLLALQGSLVGGTVSTPGTLDAHLLIERESGFQLDATLTIAAGHTVALLGPNGAGKSTAVAALAGLAPLHAGRIVLGGRTLDEPSARVFVPPEERRVGVVFQDYLLFPHLTVVDNVAFGLQSAGVSRRTAHPRAHSWLARLGIGNLAERKPPDLSGGEAQRVAFARALITEPDLLLLDEPLAALDATTRVQLRHVLADHLGDFPGPRLLITHDPTEAFLMADHIYVIEAGRITQMGTADDIRLRPRTPYAADLAGSNLVMGTASRGVVSTDAHDLAVGDTHIAGQVLATIHPRAISIHRNRPEGSPRNTWETTITRIEHYGDRVRLQTGSPLPLTAEVTPAAVDALGLHPASLVWVSIKATEISVEAR